MISNAAIVLGAVISVTVAFEPHFSSAYRLQFDVLTANILPYLLFAWLAVMAKGVLTNVVGVALVASHLVLLMNPQLMTAIWPAIAAKYSAPLLLACLLVPLLFVFRKPGWLKESTE
jgi:hypothetical protein